jgi:hypothetical protein
MSMQVAPQLDEERDILIAKEGTEGREKDGHLEWPVLVSWYFYCPISAVRTVRLSTRLTSTTTPMPG